MEKKSNNQREAFIVYKGQTISYIRGSNYAYIGRKIFISIRAAKIYITRSLKNGNR